MPDSTMLFYIAAEIAVLLLLTCLFLFFHLGKLKKLLNQFEQKIIELRKSLTQSRAETKAALEQLAEKEAITSKSFLDYMDEEIEGTREYHQSLNPDRDIVLDIATDAPLDRQAPSLRHAFLIAEKEARYAGDDEQSSWDVLQAKLQQIIQFYQSSAEPEEVEQPSSDEVDELKAQVEELQTYKKLFHDTKGQWLSAKEKAETYYEQLSSLSETMNAGQDFSDTLTNYAQSYDAVGTLFAGHGKVKIIDAEEQLTTSSLEPVNNGGASGQGEMQRLRSVVFDQHEAISDLQLQLERAESPEQQKEALAKLNEQLERQQRFLQEAETCTKLIEDELSVAVAENEALREKLNEGDLSTGNDDVGHIESVVSDLTVEGKEMLVTIATLEQENKELAQQLQDSKARGESEEKAPAPASHVDLLKTKLGEMQQELLNLQIQNIELEERYKELQQKL